MLRKITKKSRKLTWLNESSDALAIPKALVSLVESITSNVPESRERRSRDPQGRSRELARTAALKAATISGGFSLPPGPLGLLTAVPELLSIWKLQSQLVDDIAAAFGEQPPVQKEKMVYCLFKNMACQVARDAAVRIAERALVRRISVSLLRRTLWRCGVPILGAAGAAAYAWFDTMQVAKRSVTLFEDQQKPGPRHKLGGMLPSLTRSLPRQEVIAGGTYETSSSSLEETSRGQAIETIPWDNKTKELSIMETNTQGLGRRTSHRIFLWRRPSKTAQPEETPAPAERHQENQETTTPLSRRALVPLKEVYFVGIGAADWLLEQAITVERNLAKRGQRRNETLSRVASQMGASVSDKTSAMSKRGRERVQQLGEKLGDKMQSLGAEQEMPEGQPST